MAFSTVAQQNRICKGSHWLESQQSNAIISSSLSRFRVTRDELTNTNEIKTENENYRKVSLQNCIAQRD